LPDVYVVLSYYLKRRTEVESYLRQRQQKAEKLRRDNESRFDPTGVWARLLARRQGA
jgi:hypothetical protein